MCCIRTDTDMSVAPSAMNSPNSYASSNTCDLGRVASNAGASAASTIALDEGKFAPHSSALAHAHEQSRTLCGTDPCHREYQRKPRDPKSAQSLPQVGDDSVSVTTSDNCEPHSWVFSLRRSISYTCTIRERLSRQYETLPQTIVDDQAKELNKAIH